MQVTTMQGYFNNGFFYQEGRRVTLPEGKMVIVNILDVPSSTYETENPSDWLDEFHRLVEASSHEELHQEDFPRMNFGRDLISFDDKDDA